MNSSLLPRQLLLFGIIGPLAAVIGYLLASPTDLDSVALLVLILGLLSVPWLLRWHYPLLVLSWNAAVIIPLAPGSPYLWMGVGVVSFGLTLLNRILDKELKFQSVSSVTWSLLALGLVVAVTAKLTGGWGIRSLGGSTYGGKKYFYILFAIIAFFALSWRRIQVKDANFYAGGFFLSGVTALMSNLVYLAGPAVWFLFYVFPTDWAIGQAVEDFALNPLAAKFSRMGGLAVAGLAAYPFLLMKFGIRGLLDISRPWRPLLLLLVVGLSLLGGFRSAIVMFIILFVVQFINEGLVNTRMLPAITVGCLLFLGGLLLSLPFLDRLPMSMQRSLSVLQLPVSAVAKADAMDTTGWRLQMWSMLVSDVPRYFWLGKGFTTSGTDYYLSQESVRRGYSRDYETTILAGDYHSGPLSIIIPFGIWGVLAFAWFMIACLRVLYLNHRYSDPPLQKINTLLFSYFIAKLVFFLFIFGAIAIDIATFAGIVGLSISLNGGICRRAVLAKKGMLESLAQEPESPVLIGGAPTLARSQG